MKIFFKILLLVSLILLGFAVIRISLGKQPITFYSLLQYLQNTPKLIIHTYTPIFHISGEWVILDGLRVFLNGLGSILGYIGYIALEAVNALGTFFYFIKYLFV